MRNTPYPDIARPLAPDPRSAWGTPPGAPAAFRWPAPRSLRDGLHWPEPRIRTEWEASIADHQATARGSVIYYLELHGHPFAEHPEEPPVKIGHTVDLTARIKSVEKVWGKVHLAAHEPGGRATEQLRHWQFMASRMPCMPLPGGSEFFELSPLLDAHISWLLDVIHDYPEKNRRPFLPGMEVPA